MDSERGSLWWELNHKNDKTLSLNGEIEKVRVHFEVMSGFHVTKSLLLTNELVSV